MANNSAWFRIRSPVGVGSQEFTIQRGTINLVWRMKRSRTSGFTGGTPGATQTPLATDEFIFMGGGTDASPTFATFFAADGSYRWNVGADNALPFGFWAGAFPTGGGTPNAGLCLDPLISTEPTDADQFVFHMGVAGQSPFTQTPLTNESGSSTTFRTFSQIISSTPGSNYAEFPTVTLNLPSGVVVPNALPTNAITTKDEAFPLIFLRRAAIATPGYKGVSTVMRWTGTNRVTGSTLTVTTTRDRIIYGQVSLPWDGSVPAL
jgi:hypothetical protein